MYCHNQELDSKYSHTVVLQVQSSLYLYCIGYFFSIKPYTVKCNYFSSMFRCLKNNINAATSARTKIKNPIIFENIASQPHRCVLQIHGEDMLFSNKAVTHCSRFFLVRRGEESALVMGDAACLNVFFLNWTGLHVHSYVQIEKTFVPYVPWQGSTTTLFEGHVPCSSMPSMPAAVLLLRTQVLPGGHSKSLEKHAKDLSHSCCYAGW